MAKNAKNRLPELVAHIERLLGVKTCPAKQDVFELSHLTSLCGPIVNGPYGLVRTDHSLGSAALQTLFDRWPRAEWVLFFDTDKTPDLQALLDALDRPAIRSRLSESAIRQLLEADWVVKNHPAFFVSQMAQRAEKNPMAEPDFYSDALIAQRWDEMKGVLGLHHCRLDWKRGNYEHFDTPRGFAVTFNKGDPHHSQLLFTRKPMSADRFDAILRHELGHVADFAVLPGELDAFALELGVRLPPAYTHVERRADAIAELVWSTPIRYDHDLVQSLRWGVRPRPAKLGM